MTRIKPAFAIAEAFVMDRVGKGWIDPTDNVLAEVAGCPVSPTLGNLVRRIIHRDWT